MELIAGGSGQSLDEVKKMQDLGVSRLIVPPPGFAPDQIEAGFEKLQNDILSKV